MHLTSEDLKNIKEVYSISNCELAELLGVSEGLVSRIVNGKRTPAPQIVNRAVRVFHLTPEKMARIREVRAEFDKENVLCNKNVAL